MNSAATQVEVVTYRPEFKRDFASLNYAWIEHYFAVEEEDRRALENPQAYALSPGGQIFFVVEFPDSQSHSAPLANADDLASQQEVVGCVAMVPWSYPVGPGRGKVFELAKMAVRPDRQGRGYGHLLMHACIEYARQEQADEIMLVTNDALDTALAVYEKSGFVAQPAYQDARYQRGNLEMRLRLTPLD